MTSEWALVVLTGVYVLATIAICWANWASASAAKAQTEEMRRQFKYANRPRLAIRLDARTEIERSLVFKNYGNQAAIDVKISLNDEFLRGLMEVFRKSPLLSVLHSKMHISEGQEFWVLVSDNLLLGNLPDKVMKIDISYKGPDGEAYSEKTSLDLSQYDLMTWVNTKENKVWWNGKWMNMQ